MTGNARLVSLAIATFFAAVVPVAAEDPLAWWAAQVKEAQAKIDEYKAVAGDKMDLARWNNLQNALNNAKGEENNAARNLERNSRRLRPETWKRGETVRDVVLTREWLAGRGFQLRTSRRLGAPRYSIYLKRPDGGPRVAHVQFVVHETALLAQRDLLAQLSDLEDPNSTVGDVGWDVGLGHQYRFLRDNVYVFIATPNVEFARQVDDLIVSSPPARDPEHPEFRVAADAKDLDVTPPPFGRREVEPKTLRAPRPAPSPTVPRINGPEPYSLGGR